MCRVMRLCRPSLSVDLKVRVNLAEDMSTSTSFQESPVPVSAAYADRTHIEQGLDACGISGFLQLPQSFGTIYLGEVSVDWCSKAIQCRQQGWLSVATSSAAQS